MKKKSAQKQAKGDNQSWAKLASPGHFSFPHDKKELSLMQIKSKLCANKDKKITPLF